MSARIAAPLPLPTCSSSLSPSPSPPLPLSAFLHSHPHWPRQSPSQGRSHICTAQRPLVRTHCPRPYRPSRPYRLSCAATAAGAGAGAGAEAKKTCRQCKKQFTDSENSPTACRYHTAHYGGETRRKFESVYTGGTMDTADGGQITAYWHCCGNQDAFDTGCVASPHRSFDD